MELNDQLGYNLYRAALLFRRELIRALREHDLSPEQWQTLASLWAHGPLSPSEIARVTLQDLPSISRMISRMEKRGWIVRVEDPKDGRSFRVDLTWEGRQLQAVLPPLIFEHFEEVLDGFPELRRRRLLELLQELRQVLGDPTP
ncbi:MarR family winged helix-turn-helix transcriptional regulator [Vitiosangium sp. GDMCC 1.1324]|uniref:MarR family winged helix-turn-helix transcriptional regulator n=1 Tax=Vitiosangium sp. (strain GDMCC 1.1324) TaxID=2138576 RepID=UPI0018EEA6F9|nr:MarR family transcriptional regulator [Vitiosangium sp. GDMCC 1.1324]